MASLTQLVGAPSLSELLAYVARPRADPVVEHVALVEDLAELDRVAPRTVVLLTRGASASAGSYRFDMALRAARGRDVAALVLSTRDVGRITPTAAAIADRSGTAILGTADEVDLAELAVAICREIAGGADVALLRAYAAVRAVKAHPADGSTDALLDRAGAALGVPLAMEAAEPGSGPHAAVRVDDHVEGWVTAAGQDGDLAMGLDIVLQAAAAGLGQSMSRSSRAEELPIRSQEEALAELLAAPAAVRPQLFLRARSLGVPIDDWHVAVRLDFEDVADAPAADPLATEQDRSRLAHTLLRLVRGAGVTWYGSRSGAALLLLAMFSDDPGQDAGAALAAALEAGLRRVAPRLPTTGVRCGVGSAHEGPAGLLASVAEAKAAATTARTSAPPGTAVAFDSIGLRRTLVEWYASDTARDAVTTVLAPLTELGGARAERLIQTLHVYLDHRGSLTRTADALNLHRNAVSYRITKIFGLLDVDQHNADDMLLLQLACRARELEAGS